ncbi:multidrug transporter [Zestomonas thermotolerans]|uniref:multidrug transporter n=1 Tax=Zestomonas thermotolerans TaxID=157784 RepID=UPI0023F4C126|nr:multidrug transporter [Pseudomonas thermotolerans]
MNLFRSTAAALALTTAAMALPLQAWAGHDGTDPMYNVEAPPAFAMVGDLVVARPLLIGATLVGAAVFVVSLPFTALGGNIKEAGQALVSDPAREAFARCLGCTSTARSQ